MSEQPTLTLNDERAMPQLGFGTYKLKGDEARNAVRSALETGYWLVDTASVYENEKSVGEGVGEWSDIFLQTKVWNDDQGFEQAKAALRESLERLGRSFVDMALIHWPCPDKGKFVDSWKALIDLREEGLAHSIGVSNFREQDLDAIIDATGVVPALNQIELHPTFQQRALRKAHEERGIVTQCWSPLGQGQALDEGPIGQIAQEIGEAPAAVVLAWHLHHGLAPIPKSGTPEHIADNFTCLDITLSDEQVAAIDALDDKGGRIGPDPAELN